MSRPGSEPRFTFIDLFAGIGGFHSALTALGGECVLACEVDKRARAVYERNWGAPKLFPANAWSLADPETVIPERCDVLTAGFPCQPFSKSGKQLGRRDERGTLFDAILNVVDRYLKDEKPIPILLLENVRNLTGPRHRADWLYIIDELRERGYRVSDKATIFSPHLLPPERGGTPQHRERVFIGAVYTSDSSGKTDRPPRLVANRPVADWDPSEWDILAFLEELHAPDAASCPMTELDREALDAWDQFVQHFRRHGVPGFPIWTEFFSKQEQLDESWPSWKKRFVRLNKEFYREHRSWLDGWMRAVLSDRVVPSRRKFEWQASEAASIWRTAIQFRPSGIRCRSLTYLPALVAITQTSLLGPLERYLSPLEAAALQGLPASFTFGDQSATESYRQVGNAVATGAVKFILGRLIAESTDLRLPRALARLADGPAPLQAIPQALRASGEALNSISR